MTPERLFLAVFMAEAEKRMPGLFDECVQAFEQPELDPNIIMLRRGRAEIERARLCTEARKLISDLEPVVRTMVAHQVTAPPPRKRAPGCR